MGILTDLKARGTQDILITATDNLHGFTDTIKTIFPSANQICVVHQIKNSCPYIVCKNRKEFTRNMTRIYTAPAKAAPKDFKDKWEFKYSHAIKS